MLPKHKVFFHKKDRLRLRYEEGTLEYEVSEIVYDCFLELTGVAYSFINRAYPKAKREHDPKLDYRWADAHHQAKEFLTHYKNLAKNEVIPLAILSFHKDVYDDSEDLSTREFKQLLVDNNLQSLYMKLRGYGPAFVTADEVIPYEKVLDATHERVKSRLLDALSYYEAAPRYTSEDLEKEFEQNNVRSTRTHP